MPVEFSQLRPALNSARRRARLRGKGFGISLSCLEKMWNAQFGRCALSGLTFDNEHFANAHVKRPFAPSIDRIDPHGDYVVGNVRLVCTAVNFARGQWGDDVLRQIAHGIVETEKHDERSWYRIKQNELMDAQNLLDTLQGDARRRQIRRIAGLKASLTKGPSRLRSAGRRASKSRES